MLLAYSFFYFGKVLNEMRYKKTTSEEVVMVLCQIVLVDISLMI